MPNRNIFTSIIPSILIFFGVIFLFDGNVEASELPDWEIPERGCSPQGQTIVNFRVIQDRGYLNPDALVNVGDLVRLEGMAENVIRDRNCEVREVPIRFTWSMSYTSPDGARSNQLLTDQNTLDPSFHADQEGKYTVTLSTSPVRETLHIFAENVAAGGKWMSIGPYNVGGRINAISIDPVTKFIYAGAESGGLWRSRDGGGSWQPLSDNGVYNWGMPNIKINALALTRINNFATIYAGLNDYGGIWVYSEEGKHWARAGGNPNLCDNRLLQRSTINKIVIHPFDSSILYAATNNGVFRTQFSGCWERVLVSPNPVKPVQDLVITKSQTPLVFASIQSTGIYRATDSSPTTWTLLNGLAGSKLPPSNPFSGGVGFVSEGDKRLYVSLQDRFAGVPTAGTIVQAGDPDMNRALAGFRGDELHGDPNSDGIYFDELIYRHKTGRSLNCPFFNHAVDTTDMRFNGLLGTIVLESHPDYHSCLFPFHSREKYAVNPNYVDDKGKPVYPFDGSVYREDGDYNKIVLAVSDTNPLIVYAGFEPEPYQVFRSTDGGTTWTQTASAPHRCDNQCGHNDIIAVHPQNPNVVLLGQVPLYASVDGGNSWKDISLPNENPYPRSDFHAGIHSDQLSLTFDPSDPSKFYVGSDGGIYRFSFDVNNPRSYWTAINNELATSWFYDSGLAPKDRFLVAGGLQDNSNLHRQASKLWESIDGGGDGFHTEFDATSTFNSQIIYRNSYWGNPNDGWNIYQWRTTGPAPFITTGKTFFASPYRSSMAVINNTGQLYHAKNLLSTPLVNCIDPTPKNPSDQVTSIIFLNHPSSSTQDKVVAGMSDGSIYIIRNADAVPQRPLCKDTDLGVATKVYSNDPIPSCPRTPGAVTDIALKPRNSNVPADVIYATYTGVGAGPGRVLRIPVLFDEEATGFCGRDITGDLPNGLEAKNIVVDPVNNDVLYLGTSKGIFTGKFNSSENKWHWTPSTGAPPVKINSLEMQQNSAGRKPPVIRAATDGRGVWELLKPRIEDFQPSTTIQPSNASLLRSVSPNGTALSYNNISDCTIRQFDDPQNRNRVVAVDVDFTFQFTQGQNIGIRPIVMNNGSDSGLFLSEVKKLEDRQGNESMLIVYAGQDAPLKLNTDAIRLEIFEPSKGVLFSKICKSELTWKNPEARSLNVDAVGINREGPTEPVFAPFSISGPNITTTKLNISNESITPSEIIRKNGAQVNLSIPVNIKTGIKNWTFSGWVINGTRFDSTPKISLNLTSDMNVTAQFFPASQTEPETTTIQALCECPIGNAENKNKINSTLLLNIPIEIMSDSRVDTIYTPMDMEPKSTTLKIRAPEIVQLANNSLRFVGWTTTDQENQNDPILTLRISGDAVATAKYQLK